MSTDIHSLAGAYALNAVGDLERAEFARHLTGCDTCRLEVVELSTAAARLADSTWSAAPPRLRDKVLSQAARTRQARPGGRGRHGVVEPARPGRLRRWGLTAAAAVLLATGVGAATVALEEQRVRHERDRARAAQQWVTQVQTVLAADDARARQVPVAGGGRLSVVYSARLDAGVVMLAGLERPGDDWAYQLWLRYAGGVLNAGLLPAGQGAGVRLVSGVRDAAGVAVSLEPVGGSPRPGRPVVDVDLTWS